MSRGRGHACSFLALLVALLGPVAIHPPQVEAAPSGSGGRGKCFGGAAGFARDHAAPLRGLPRVHPPMPGRGRLPFGPRGVGFFGGGVFGPVLVDGRTYGYRFHSRRFDGVRTRLGWFVTARMLSVDADGRPTGVLARKRIRVRVVGGERQPGIFLKAGEETGFYRFDIRFRDRRGRWLGAFTDYLRVMEPRVEVRLGIESRTLHAGDLLRTRVENPGTETVYYGAGHERVEKLEGSTWRPVPGALRNTYVHLYLGILGPGAVARCSALEIKPFMTPGRYRVVKKVGLDYEWQEDGRSTEVSAWFDVVG